MTRFCLMSAATVLVAAISFYGCSGSDDPGNGGDGGSGGTAATGGDGGSGGTGAVGGGGSGGPGGATGSGGDGGIGGDDPPCPNGGSFCEDFESGTGLWFADNGVWEVGEATSGPGSCFEGSGCAATVLDGDYPRGRGSRLTSGIIALPAASENEELHLRFQNWFAFGAAAAVSTSAEVQISVRQPDSTFGGWVKVGSVVLGLSAVWSVKDVELTPYAGETVRLGFVINREGASGPGWYIDDIEIVAKLPEFTTDFEDGWVDWSATNGIWEVGEATSGPGSCFEGSGCAATVLDGDYPRGQTSRLVSATTALPTEGPGGELRLRFQNWFVFGAAAAKSTTAEVQLSVRQPDGTFGGWGKVGSVVLGASGGWELRTVELTPYAGETVRLGFVINREGASGPGWYIDDIEILPF